MVLSQLHEIFVSSEGVCTDTRKITSGCIFFALKGANFNGNTFALEALRLGAGYAVVDEDIDSPDSRLIRVNDVLGALQDLANYHRRKLKARIIGITGTNGKTTTKELMYAVLAAHFKTKATEGNLNNHIGVPLTLLSFKGDEEFGIVEMGANHSGEIAELCEIAEPDFGLITNVGKAHLEGFGSFEVIVKTKKGLYDHIAEKGGTIFINSADEILIDNKVENRVYYGTNSSDFCRGVLLDASPFLRFSIFGQDGETEIVSKLIGAYNFENMLAAVAVGKYFGVPENKIISAIEGYVPSNNRSEFRKTDSNELILDAYNANPSSMEKALENFANMNKPNKLAILGDMFELGADSQFYHEKIANKVSSLGLHALFVGEEFYKINPDSPEFYQQINMLMDKIKTHPISGRTILIKGSRGVKLERLVEYL